MYEDIADLPAGVVMTVARHGRQESFDLWAVSGTGSPALSCVLLQLGLGLLLREAIRLESDAAQQPPPTNSLERWALIAQQAINFTRSPRRVSVALPHYGDYSLRNTAGSRPTLK